MKTVKMKDLLKKNPSELNSLVAELEAELDQVRASLKTQKPTDDNSQGLKIRKQIARTKTATKQLTKKDETESKSSSKKSSAKLKESKSK